MTTTCSGGNVELCRSLGANEVIDYRSTDLIASLKECHSSADSQFDLLIDNVDTPSLYFNSEHYLKPTGRYITIAGSISLRSTISILQILYLPSFLGGGKRPSQFLLRKSDIGQYLRVAELIRDGKVKPIIESEYSLEEAAEAFKHLKGGRTIGKIVVKVGQE